MTTPDRSQSEALDGLLERIQLQIDLDAETENEVLAEIRDHLQESVAAARAEGLSEKESLARAAADFGVEQEVGQELQAAHAGWGTADAVIASALPVVCALILRWLVFAPDGTVQGWPQLLSRPAFWIVALAALLIPVLRFERWRYALVTWMVFWVLTVIFVTFPAYHW